MICCFMNLHEQKNAKGLKKHFDEEIERAIDWGCSTFVAGMKYPEDKLFSEMVLKASKRYKQGEINLVQFEEPDDEKLKHIFIRIADWEIYSYK